MTTRARHPSAHPATAGRTGERGFTLIELSIVLVIIGLLVGGILQGQEMINSTRLKTTIAQIDGLTAAVQTFQDKYNGLPGDVIAPVTTVIGSPVAGNGNGGIGNAAAGSVNRTLVQNTAEAPVALDHLFRANLLSGGVAAGAATVYQARLDNAFLDLLTVNNFTDAAGAVVAPREAVRIRGNNGVAVPTPGISPADALSIDIRYDDGAATVGRFQSQGGATCAAAGVYVAGSDPTCISGMMIN